MSDPYAVPDDGRNRHYAFSGGRSSAYLMHHVVERNGGLPDGTACIFANTGKEREETLDFVQRCAEEWGITITWLEYQYRPAAAGGASDPKHAYVVVDHAVASRDGQPFEQLIRSKRRVPSTAARFCTTELKVKTAERYLRRACGWSVDSKHYRTVLGIRYDEPRRWRKTLYEQCATEYPLVDARVDKADVLRFWRAMPWDLEMANSDFGNCDLCFMKGRSKVASLAALEPCRVEWWERMEAMAIGWRSARSRGGQVFQGGFDRNWRYSDLAAQGSIDYGEPDDVSCFCGD